MFHRKHTFAVLSVLILLSLVLASCSAQANAQTGSTSSSFTGTGTVAQTSYTDTVESTGQIQSQRITSLSFSTTGTVAQSKVQVGQTVNAGDTLMTLDPTSVPGNLQTAQTDLTNARNALNQLTNPDFSTIASAMSALASAYTNYQQAQNDLSNAIISNQNANTSNLYTNWLVTKTALQAAQNNLPLANASIDIQAYYQAVRDTSQLQAELKVAQDSASVLPDNVALAQKVTDLQAAVQESQTKLNELQAGLSAETVDQVSSLSESLSAFEASATDFIGSVITDTTNTNVNLAQLQADLTQKQSSLISTQSDLTNLTNQRAGMYQKRCADDTIADYQTAYDRALNAYNFSGHIANSREYQMLKTAEANLNWCTAVWSEADKAAQDAKIASAQAQIQLLQAQINQDQSQISDAGSSVYSLAINLNTDWAAYQDAIQKLNSAVTNLYELERSPNTDDLAAAKAIVQSAQAEVNSLTLTAPYNGEVTKVGYQPGDSVNQSTPAIVLVDRSKLYVDLQIDESHVAKLSPGDKASISLEAMPNLKLTGSVSYINPVGASNQGVVYYEVHIAIDQADSTILIGATADVTIYAGQAQNVLTVPVSAVGSDSQGEYVYVVDSNGNSQQVKVVSGQILADNTVIVTGNLQAGQTVGLLAGSSTSSNNGGFGGGGGGGGFISP
jgi:multidrug efflux pump subunit AcrA (membrane-fusion protein)